MIKVHVPLPNSLRARLTLTIKYFCKLFVDLLEQFLNSFSRRLRIHINMHRAHHTAVVGVCTTMRALCTASTVYMWRRTNSLGIHYLTEPVHMKYLHTVTSFQWARSYKTLFASANSRSKLECFLALKLCDCIFSFFIMLMFESPQLQPWDVLEKMARPTLGFPKLSPNLNR